MRAIATVFEPWKDVAMTGCTKRLCTAILLILLGMHGLSAHVSLGFELGLPGTVATAAIYEQQSLRAELAAHFFALNLATAAVTENGFKDLQFNEFIGKAILSTRLTPTERHVLYGGAGLLGYFDLHSQEYMVAAGPALQYAWKFPEKKGSFTSICCFLWSISTTMKIPYLRTIGRRRQALYTYCWLLWPRPSGSPGRSDT